jgi:NAD+ kinase
MRKNGETWDEDETHVVLNEIVIDKGGSSGLTNLDCFCNDRYVTTVQGTKFFFFL